MGYEAGPSCSSSKGPTTIVVPTLPGASEDAAAAWDDLPTSHEKVIFLVRDAEVGLWNLDHLADRIRMRCGSCGHVW